MRSGDHPRGRAPQARHDPRRPVRDQRRHRVRLDHVCGQVLPQGDDQHHLQPRELHRSHRRRGAEGQRRLRPQEADGRQHAGHRARGLLRGTDEGPRHEGRGRARRGRPRRRHHPPAALPGDPQGVLHRRGDRSPHRAHPERRHGGGGGQGRHRLRHLVDGLRRGPHGRVLPARARRRGGHLRVPVRAVHCDRAAVLREQVPAGPGRRGGGDAHRGHHALRGEVARAGQGGAQGVHREGDRVRAGARGRG
mmetsp:Transcript_5232/g.9079  ORF Transcript_5232/g.9079 Transcript_5232/m.9079 type:complete len:250 (-) Transcript_5232:487-1236(-)